MKKSTIFIFAVITMLKAQAQDYLISFAGDGAAHSVTAVTIDNLTSGASVYMYGGDVLHLTSFLGIVEPDKNIEAMQLYPNPMEGQALLTFSTQQEGEALIRIIDLSGKTVYQIRKFLSSGTHSFSISGIKQGMYFIKTNGKDYSYSTKLVSLNNLQSNAGVEFVSSVKKVSGNHLKSTENLVDMLYTEGDRLLFKATNGHYLRTIITDVPASSKTITFNFSECTDADNNHYSTVKIGTQTWMVENLKTSKYNDGSDIPLITDNLAWVDLKTPGYGWYGNNITNNNIYGALYNWYAVQSGMLAPFGWHVPTDSEWGTLIGYLGGPDIASTKLKTVGTIEAGTGLWSSPNSGATNESGFSALPGGYRFSSVGSFGGLGISAGWWPATSYSTTQAWDRYIDAFSGIVGNQPDNKTSGLSVRCIKDSPNPNLPTVTTILVSDISKNSATSGGDITSIGIAEVTERGVCWSTLSNPTINNSHTTNGSGTGSFNSNLTGLNANTPYYLKAYAKNSAGTAYGNELVFRTLPGNCGSITINHVAGSVAPVTKTVTYNTVTDILGETTKCWITSNLGADQEAASVDDSTEASAGWYWQFNRKQGYRHNGTSRIPDANWTTNIFENSDWTAENDPCTLELGADWRIPTSTEWDVVAGTVGDNWSDFTGPWNSGLKLHASGYIQDDDSSLYSRGSAFYYWSSSQYDSTRGRELNFPSYFTGMSIDAPKARGQSIRCLKGALNELPHVTTNGFTILSADSAIVWGNVYDDGGLPITACGICYSTSPNPTLANSFTTDGTGKGFFISSLSGLIPLTPYYVKAYVTNSLGTTYGEEISFSTNGYAADYHCVGYRIRPGNPTEPVDAIESLTAVNSTTVRKTGFGNYLLFDVVIEVTTETIIVGGISCYKVIATPIDPVTGSSVGGMWDTWTGDAMLAPADLNINYYNPVTNTFVLNCYYYSASGNRIMYEVLTRL